VLVAHSVVVLGSDSRQPSANSVSVFLPVDIGAVDWLEEWFVIELGGSFLFESKFVFVIFSVDDGSWEELVGMEISELGKSQNGSVLVVSVVVGDKQVVLVEDTESVGKLFRGLVALSELGNPSLEHGGDVQRDRELVVSLRLVKHDVSGNGHDEPDCSCDYLRRNHCLFLFYF
jgi:hypothetical protein